MAGADKATARMIAVVVLLLVFGATLHGYLPSPRQPDPGDDQHSPVALTGVIAVLAVSVGVLAVAIIERLRSARRTPPSMGPLTLGASRTSLRPRRRTVLIVAVLVAAWPLAVWALLRITPRDRLAELARILGVRDGRDPGIDTPAGSGGPGPPGHPGREAGPQRWTGGDASLEYLLTGAVGLLIFGLVAVAVIAVVRRPETPATAVVGRHAPGSAGAGEALSRAASAGLAEVDDLKRGPREVIIACYAAMERELDRVPGVRPQGFDTPTEVLDRAVSQGVLTGGSAADLLRLFVEARFSPHRMTEQDRTDAGAALRLVRDELRDRR